MGAPAMSCFGKNPHTHGVTCGFFRHCHEPAVKHVQWAPSCCAHLCAKHAKAVARSAGRQHRQVEVTPLKGQQALIFGEPPEEERRRRA